MSSENLSNCFADFVVKHGKDVYKVTVPLSANVDTLKADLEAQSKVPVAKQRLFLQRPVEKRFAKDAPGSTTLSELFNATLLTKITSHVGSAPQHIQVDALLIGNAQETGALIDVKATSEMARLVSTTLERDEMWFRCSYSKGYLRQTAYVCRTCVNEKRALPDHAMCLACSEVCHHDHEVEEWGVRYYMRCDCCTCKCWLVPNVRRDIESTTDSGGVTTAVTPTRAEVGQTTALRTADVESRMNRSGGVPKDGRNAAVLPLPAHPPQLAASPSATSAPPASASERSHRGRKRSRSSSPLTPKRTAAAGGSPMSGIRIAPASGPSPFGLQQPPANEQQAIQSPLEVFPSLPPASRAVAEGKHDESAVSTGKTNGDAGVAPELKKRAVEDPGVDAVNTTTASSASAPAVRAPSHDPVRGDATTAPDTTTEAASASAAVGGPSVAQQQDPFQRCQFVLDSATMRPMESSVLPCNALNRYPRDPLHWCYCRDDHPTDSPDCGGVVCMLCTTCYWSTHLTRLNSDSYRRMPCYGDVIQGDTLAFWCDTCKTYVCTSCRYRCHKDHQVNDEFICPSRDDGTDNGAPAGVNFSCGCRGLCVISESVPDADVDDPSTYAPIPNDVAIELMNNDVFTGFICSTCLDEHPWILSEDPKKCWHGQLPAKQSTVRPVVPCATPASAAVGPHVAPYHGAIFPVNVFYEDATCACDACRDAFHTFAPRATEDATEMAMQLHNACDHCGSSVKQQPAFICQTCDVTQGATFFLCAECNELRQRLVDDPTATARATTTPNAATAAGDETSPAEQDTRAYTHDLSHVFLEDTVENLSTLCGMQFMNSLDEPSRDYVVNNWEEVQENFSVTNTLTDAFGPVPIHFSKEEQEAFLEVNEKRSAGHHRRGTHTSSKSNEKND